MMAILDFINKFFSKEPQKNSKNVAKERLRLVLVSDQLDAMPEGMMDELRVDLIGAISKYMEIDEKALEVALNRTGGEVAFVANIPVLRIKKK